MTNPNVSLVSLDSLDSLDAPVKSAGEQIETKVALVSDAAISAAVLAGEQRALAEITREKLCEYVASDASATVKRSARAAIVARSRALRAAK